MQSKTKIFKADFSQTREKGEILPISKITQNLSCIVIYFFNFGSKCDLLLQIYSENFIMGCTLGPRKILDHGSKNQPAGTEPRMPCI